LKTETDTEGKAESDCRATYKDNLNFSMPCLGHSVQLKALFKSIKELVPALLCATFASLEVEPKAIALLGCNIG
jgi:hypothetical protein